MVRGFRFAGVVGFAIAMAAAGCSLLVDTSGLGGTTAADDAANDHAAPNDGGALDAGDADASSSSDSARTCDATFCDDFDDGPLGAKWTKSMLTGGGTLALDTPALSLPNALRAQFHGVSSPTDRYAMLEQDLGLGRAVRCDFAMNVTHRPNKDLNDVFRIRTRAPGIDDYLLYFAVATAGGALADDIAYPDGGCACPQRYESFPVLPEGTWVHVTVQTDFTTAQVTIDGQLVVDKSFGPLVPNEPIVVGLGGRAFSSIISDTLFDDFSCTVTR
jgi:hypothetical protein